VQDLLWNTCFNHGAGLSVGRGNQRDVSKNSLAGSSAALAANGHKVVNCGFTRLGATDHIIYGSPKPSKFNSGLTSVPGASRTLCTWQKRCAPTESKCVAANRLTAKNERPKMTTGLYNKYATKSLFSVYSLLLSE